MAVQDNIPITTLERAVSSDIIDLQALISRASAEIVRGMVKEKVYHILPNAIDRDHVASGLFVVVSGGNLYLGPGMLMQGVTPDPPDVPTPGSLDSYYRFGFNYDLEAITDPWDATSAWWLLEARVELVDTLTETRDIYNPTTDTFAPSGSPIVKRQESQIVTNWSKGTSTTIPPVQPGYAPLFAIYRPSGGGTITSDDMVQLSTQLDDLTNHNTSDGIAKRTSAKIQSSPGGIGYSSAYVEIDFAGEIGGKKLFARSDSLLALRSSDFVSPDDSGQLTTDGLWWYVYLAHRDDLMPTNLYGSNLEHRGVLFISRVPPNDHKSNSASISLPLPIGGTVDAGEALFVGVFRASGTSGDIHFIHVANNGEGRVDVKQFNNDSFLMNAGNSYRQGTINLATSGPSGTEDVPHGCHLKCFVQSYDLDTGSTALSIEVTWRLPGDSTSPQDWPKCLLSCRNHMLRLFEIYPRNNNLSLTVAPVARSADMSASGGGLSDGGTNEYEAGIWGIRLI